MIKLLFYVLLVMLGCLIVQAATIAIAGRRLASVTRRKAPRLKPIGAFVLTAELMLLLMLGIVVQISLWALFYRYLDLIQTIQTFEQALYFSGVTFTSLGYGDIVLPERYRLIAVLEAATGLLMFGITTAVLVSTMGNSFKLFAGKPDDSRKSD
ncbi:MAG: potassium channel family protein [Polymorphobacter sp.]